MACPMHGSLGRLPGKNYDKSSKQLRTAMLAGEVDLDVFIEENYGKIPKTRDARFENQVKRYATASIVIEHFWRHLQKQLFVETLKKAKASLGGGSHEEQIRNFMVIVTTVHDCERNRFANSTMDEHPSAGTAEEKKFLLSFLSTVSLEEGLQFPSMTDLFMLLGRFAGVAPEVFRRDVGRQLTDQELFGLLRHPHLPKFFLEIMVNDRMSTLPLVAKLEGRRRPGSKFSPKFKPEFFEIKEKKGVRSLQVKQEVIAQHCAHHARSAARREKRNIPNPRFLGCPALYTGKFKEMYDWTVSLFETWYSTSPAETVT